MVRIRQFILLIGDLILCYLSLFITVIIGFWGTFNWEIYAKHTLPFSLIFFFWLVVLYIFGLYDLDLIRPKVEFLLRLGETFIISLLIGATFFYTVPFFKITPKTNLLIEIAIFTFFVFLWRKLFCSLFSSFYRQNIAFLGKNSLAGKMAEKFGNQPQLGYNPIGFIDIKKDLLRQLKNKKIDTLAITDDISQNPRLVEQLYNSLPLKINLIDFSEIYEVIFRKIPIDFIDYNWFLKNLREGKKRIYDNIKRIEDIILGSLITILTSPLWLIFSLLIKMEDKGPVFYRQKRVGKNKEVFWLWKFRSMRPDSEKEGAKWADKKDNRVTKIGSFLRKSHLDEIAQMINVIKGDLSMVGPRPERPVFVKKLEKEIPHYHLRHIIKPGFTGWAQVNFRYARTVLDSHEKFQYDLYYLKNRSFSLDLSCLLKTFYLFFKRES